MCRCVRSLDCVGSCCRALFGCSGCVTHETRPQPRVKAIQASTEIPAEQLLDVGVRLFDENVPKDEKKLEKEHIFPEVRKAEARYFPMQIRNTLEGTGHWGQVRVMPADADALDVYVVGQHPRIHRPGAAARSDGRPMRADAQWFRKEYEQPADTRSYKDQSGRPRDPFQNLYSTLANDMLAYRQQLAAADLENVRRVSELRFASDLAPYAFQSYLSADKKKGTYQVTRLPAEDDPLLVRMDRIRERDYALLDTINEHYSLFADNMSEPYTNWRRYSYAELEAEDEAQALGADAQAARRRGDRRRTGRGQRSEHIRRPGGGDRRDLRRRVRREERLRQGRRSEDALRLAQAARRIVPGRSAADGRRGRRPHAAVEGHGRRAVPRVAAAAEGTLRERNRLQPAPASARGGCNAGAHARRRPTR